MDKAQLNLPFKQVGHHMDTFSNTHTETKTEETLTEKCLMLNVNNFVTTI